MPNEELTTQLAARAAAPAQRGETIADLIDRQKAQIALALPSHISPDRFARIVLTELRRNPKLGACDPVSLLGALMQSAQLGLEPGPLGQAYLVPYGSEVTFIIGYRGLIDLFRRSGHMSSIVADVVYEADDFDFWRDEDGDHFQHVPLLWGERGQAYAYYAVARFKDGGQLVHVMPRDDIDKHRARSRSKGGPWNTDYDAMARKTVIRAMAPYLPLSAEIGDALDADEKAYEWRGAPVAVEAPQPPPEPQPALEVEAAVEVEGPVAEALPPPSAYDTWLGGELAAACQERGLNASGTKAELIERLIEADEVDEAARQSLEEMDELGFGTEAPAE